MEKQTLPFQAEVQQLLHLVTHALYSNKEIFLRELISNASDACDKLRFEALSDASLLEGGAPLAVRLRVDREAGTLTVSDNGIGMSAAEAVSHLGTIAKSGTREFMRALSGDQQKDAQLIGQFGVGFYSGFIVADRITVESRRAGLGAAEGVRWSSDGSGAFEVDAIERAARGTDVILHLREDAAEYLDRWRLSSLVTKYSDHIALPIEMRKEVWDKDAGEIRVSDEWETLNAASALWTRSKSEISEAQYHAFYEALTHDSAPPLAHSHNRVEGRSEYTQLLYLPASAPHDLWNRDRAAGVKLYVRRVFIMDDAQALLPAYLRFVRGVVDSSDLPLNVSRELLQESRDVRLIREGCTKRVLSMLEDLAENASEKYLGFWREFGAVLKEGVGEDFGNRERLAKLLRFESTTQSEPTSLTEVLARMKEGQESIYVLTAESLAAAKSSPQLELFRKKGIEVLLLSDRVDEWLLSHLSEFEGKPIKSVARGAVDLGALQDEAEKAAAEAAGSELQPVLERLRGVLKDRAKEVRVTARLVESPACLVADEGEISSHLARLLKQAGQLRPEDAERARPVLEINPEHALVRRLAAEEARFDDLAQLLFDQAVLAEGGQLEDPAAFVRRLNQLLVG
ncbi:MAG: molecular chaperone HtpG [Pseudomonadota bacterium]|jgi:molecular chaperone HtpG